MKNLAEEKRIYQVKDFLTAIVGNVPTGVIVVNQEGYVILCNALATEYLKKHLSVASVIDNHILDFVSNTKLKDVIQDCLSSKKDLIEISKIKLNNRFLRVKAKKVVRGVLIIIEDITEMIQNSEKELLYKTYHDELTGLYNRNYLNVKLNDFDSLKYIPLSVIIGDVNGLKITNDSLGNLEGDKLIKIIADIFRKTSREGDFVFRTGGDEFLMLLPETTKEESEKICNKIIGLCKKNKDAKIAPSIALGLAVKLEEKKDIQSVFKEAEDQMYKNKVFESESVNNTIIKALETMLRETTNETLEHSLRVEKYSIDIGNEINLSEWEINTLASLAHLHDIGKVTIPISILEKAGPLNSKEWEIIKRHPEMGYKIANSSPKLTRIAEGILAHHEWWNGMGYPKGLKGYNIPILARIITVVDAFDVMTSGRIYKEPMSINSAVEELISCSGSQFDPKIVKIFVDQLKY